MTAVSEEYVSMEDLDYEHIDMKRTDVFVAVSSEIAKDTLAFVDEHDMPVDIKSSFYTRYGKRALDIGLASAALIVTLPVNLALGIGTFLDVGKPIFFRQQRVGKDGKFFTIIKFRNMTNATDEKGALLPAAQRVTRFGGIVRRTSLDELLNFWSVLKGDMSIIGPRPLPAEYIPRYSRRHEKRLAARPGLECPIIQKLDHAPTWQDQFENDVYYVEHLSLKLDVKMIFALARMVFDRKSVALRGAAHRGSFMGYTMDGVAINSQRVPVRYVRAALENTSEKSEPVVLAGK